MLKQVVSVRAAFCPFSKHSTSTKVFLSRVYSKENSKANPQCKIDVVVTHHTMDPAIIDVEFKDGNKYHIDAMEMKGDDIVTQVEKYSNKLTQQEDLKGQ